MYDWIDELGRCERLGEIVPETELVSIVADNEVELKLCASCADEINTVRSAK